MTTPEQVLLLASLTLLTVSASLNLAVYGRHAARQRRARATIARMAADRVSRETSPIYVVLGTRRAAIEWAADHTNYVHPSRVFSVTQGGDVLRGYDGPIGIVDIGASWRTENPHEHIEAAAVVANIRTPLERFPRGLPFKVYWPGLENGELPQ